MPRPPTPLPVELLGKPFTVNVKIDSGKLEPDEILAELVIGRIDGRDFLTRPETVTLSIKDRANGVITFSCRYEVKESGKYSYGIRITPYNKAMGSKQEAGLALWG